MKARIKMGSNAGRTIDVVDVDGYYFRNSKSGHLYCKEELDFSGDTVDWAAFRREAAKDFMSAIITREAPQYNFACRNVADRVTEAIVWADELIKQLKEEQK